MGSSGGALYARTLQCVLHDARYAVGSERSLRSDCAEEHGVVGVFSAPAVLNIAKQSFANVLRQRQPNLIPAFPSDLYRAALPVNVTETEPDYVSSPKSETG